MLRHSPVGVHKVPKLSPLSCDLLDHQTSVRFRKLISRPGSSDISKTVCGRHQALIVAKATPPASIQMENVSDTQPSSRTLGEVVVVGAGPAGCLLTHYLLRRGFSVHLFEKRPATPPLQPEEDGSGQQVYARGDPKSYTILLTSRAMKAFEGAGLKVPPGLLNQLMGSCMHLPNGKKRKINYSNEPGLQSFGVSRNALVAWLQQSLHDGLPNLTTYFEYELKSVDPSTNTASFKLSSKDFFSPKPESVEVKYDFLVGADGVSSAVRAEMMQLDNLGAPSPQKNLKPLTMDFQRSGDTYKSFYVSPEIAKKSPVYEDRNRVQAWPAVNALITGMADGSFWGGTKNKQLMNASSAHEVEIMLRAKAPELFEVLLEENPNFCEDFLTQPTIAGGGAVILSRFHHGNTLVIGDAAHAMFPSYGTGCNAALEDCQLLDQILGEFITGNGSINYEEVGMEFSKRRLEDAHAIVRMNTTQELYAVGFFPILQLMLFTSLRKLAPKIFKPVSYLQLWSNVPFRQIELQKRTENRLFYGLLVVVALLVVAALLFAFGVQPKLKWKPSS